MPNAADQKNPLAVPMLADFGNLPPLYVTACEFDPLRDDSQRLVERAKAAGAEIEFHLWADMVHGAISLMGWVDYMGPEVDRIGEFLRRVTGAS
ncbi:MAG: alpha/beta hydrolase fold domain-containing protein [Pseudolabrys sp.]